MWLNRRERPYDLRAQPMISLAAAAILGILADRASSLMVTGWLIVAGLSAVVGATLWKGRGHRIGAGWLTVLLSVAVASGLHSRIEQRKYDAATISQLTTEDGHPILLRARVRSDIQRRPSLRPKESQPSVPAAGLTPEIAWETRFIADVQSVRYGTDWQSFKGGLYVTVNDDLASLSPGDSIEIGGDISKFGAPTNPGESDFRVVARNRHLHARLFVDSSRHVKILKQGSLGIRRVADSLARSGEQTLQASLGGETGPLASALVVGRRATLDTQLKERLLETGTIHLLSVSGLHLGIVATVVLWIGVVVGLKRHWLVTFVAIACFLFAAITGANPPVVRAAILVGAMLTALLLNRRQWPLSTLAFAALILIWLNPTNIEQVGVQLSFISVATLVCCTRMMDPAADDIAETFDPSARIESLIDGTRSPRDLWFRRKARYVRQLAWLSLCVTLTTLPLTWLHFNIISPIAVVSNLLLSVPASIALITGLLAVVSGWVWEPLAFLPGIACHFSLKLIVFIIETTGRVPLGHAWLPSPPAWWVAMYFLVLIGLFGLKRKFNRPRAFVLGSVAWCVAAWCLAVSPAWSHRNQLNATFIDVGHGTSVLVEMPEGTNYLYDCGRLGNEDGSSHGVQDVLWSRGLTRLDAVILSHADADHYNSLPGLMRRFRFDEVITPPGLFAGDVPALNQIHDRLRESGIPIREVSKEDGLLVPDSKISILHPPRIRLPGSDNANSLVLQIEVEGRSFLLPGDLEPPGTEAVTNLPRPLAGGVMMAPHHGSLTAKTQSMLDWARPSVVVVSGGERAKNPKVQSLLEVRGSRVFVTAMHGALKVAVARDAIRVASFTQTPW